MTTTTNYGIEQRRQWLFNSLQLSALEFVCFTCSYRTIGYSLSYSHVFHFSLQNTNIFLLRRGNARCVGDARYAVSSLRREQPREQEIISRTNKDIYIAYWRRERDQEALNERIKNRCKVAERL